LLADKSPEILTCGAMGSSEAGCACDGREGARQSGAVAASSKWGGGAWRVTWMGDASLGARRVPQVSGAGSEQIDAHGVSLSFFTIMLCPGHPSIQTAPLMGRDTHEAFLSAPTRHCSCHSPASQKKRNYRRALRSVPAAVAGDTVPPTPAGQRRWL
jgi:hypothetical protein